MNPHWRPSPAAGALWVLAVALGLSGCASGTKPVDACIEVNASPSVNLYDGQAHAITLYFYPLSSPTGFEQATIDDLVKVTGVDGATGPTISVTLGPGEVQELKEAFPATTAYVGIVADYYQAGAESPGKRRALVSAKCSIFGSPKITLTARELLVD